jgi:hypothetical protein
MVKTANDTHTPSASAGEALKRRKKLARKEAKLMLAIEEAKKDQTKAQKKQAKAQARLEVRSAYLHTLEAKMAELRTPGLEPEIVTPPYSAELEPQQEPSELENSMVRSDGQQLALPDQEEQGEITALTDQALALPQVEVGIGTASSSSETATSTSTDSEPTPPFIEEATPSEVIVVTNEVTAGAAVQDNETSTETEPAPTPATPGKAPARKTAAARKPAATRRPARQSTATKRPASRSQSTRQPPSDAGHEV